MKLSILNLAPVPKNGNAVEAFENTTKLAQLAETLGYSRFWVAEHHGIGNSNSSSTPEVLIAHIAANTSTIRVGSGAVLLNHTSPFKVAETFRVLHALYPGRIDLGLGRASGMPIVDFALQQDRSTQRRVDDHDERVTEVVAWLENAFPEGHPFADVRIAEGLLGNPEPWVLGSSPSSALVAGKLGLRYCFATFLNPGATEIAVNTYREAFQPSPFDVGVDAPYLSLGVNVASADSDDEADRLRATAELSMQMLARGVLPSGPRTAADEAIAALGLVPEPIDPRSPQLPRYMSGSPERIHEFFDRLHTQFGADELMIQDLIADTSEQHHSYELLSESLHLPRPLTSVN